MLLGPYDPRENHKCLSANRGREDKVAVGKGHLITRRPHWIQSPLTCALQPDVVGCSQPGL